MLPRWFWILVLLLVPSQVMAANHYIRAAAIGTADGSDWTNAYTTLPAALTRGDVYYIASGAYGSYLFDDAVSGVLTIEVRAATIADHGTATGWSDAFAGVATFACASSCGVIFDIQQSYFILNGASRTSNWQSGHGLKVSNVNLNATTAAVRVGQNYIGNTWYNNITLQFIDIDGSHAINDTFPTEAGLQIGSGSQNVTVEYAYIHDTGGPTLFMRGPGSTTDPPGAGFRFTDTILVQYSYLARNYSSVVKHAEGCSCSDGIKNLTIRYNYWFDNMGTSIFATPSGGTWQTGNQFNGPWSIYGNVLGYTQNPAYCGLGGGAIALFDVAFSGDVFFVNNTITHMRDGGDGCPGTGTGRVIVGGINTAHAQNIYYYNNLVWNSEPISFFQPTTGTAIMDYNAYYDETSTDDVSANKQIATGNPFTNWLANTPGSDFTPVANTNTGLNLNTLVPGNALDMNARARTTWTRGAFEFNGNSPPPFPDPPSGGSFLSSQRPASQARSAAGARTSR